MATGGHQRPPNGNSMAITSGRLPQPLPPPQGSKLLRTQAWCSEEEKDNNPKSTAPQFPATVEFALHTFNQQSKDDYAYRLMRILSSWREYSWNKRDNPKMVFSMQLQLHRTWCEKFEEDIDNCPFRESTKLNSVRPDTSFLHLSSCGGCMGAGGGGRKQLTKPFLGTCLHLGHRAFKLLLCPWGPDLLGPRRTLICLFTVRTEPWISWFELLNKTCSEGLP
ncbi:cystatin-9-like [Lemur catta]|uniref:cystatin-9-like n=1 Tax=Lemur catta TaxID=9447 RepID=UPI001E26885A|nr:cystatin-9-like [Lemur catta]